MKRFGEAESEISEPSVSLVTSRQEDKKRPLKGQMDKNELSPEVYHFYYDLITRGPQWEKPEGFQGDLKEVVKTG